MPDLALSALITAPTKNGKSRLLSTAPGPRLILDAEGGQKWLPVPQVRWDPAGPPPSTMEDGSPLVEDVSVIVHAKTPEIIRQAYQWVSSGKHYFKSAGWDSTTEIQKRYKDEIGGASTLTEPNWGLLLSQVELEIRRWRDLANLDKNPLNVFFLALPVFKDGKWRADVQGALFRSLPTFVDVIGYLHNTVAGDSGLVERYLQIMSGPDIEAGDRTDALVEKFGRAILTSRDRENVCDLSCIVDVVNRRG